MIDAKWIDQRDVDATDALNSVANPGLRKNNNPYVHAAINDQFMMALRRADGVEPRAFVCPEPMNQTIPAGSTFDYEVPSEPNTWLWAIAASIENYADLSEGDTVLVQISDSETGSTVFSQPIDINLLTGTPIIAGTPTQQGSGNGYRGPLYVLSTPHLYEPPSYPVVRLVNVAAVHAIVARVTLYTTAEYDV